MPAPRRAVKRLVIDLADVGELVIRVGGKPVVSTSPAGPASPSSADPPALDLVTADIVGVLAEARHRMTTSQLLRALETAGCVHGEATIRRRLASAVRAGLLTSRDDVLPPGYGLPRWDMPGRAER